MHHARTLSNVLLTPRMAGHRPYLNDRRFEIMIDNCRAFAAERIAQHGGQGVVHQHLPVPLLERGSTALAPAV